MKVRLVKQPFQLSCMCHVKKSFTCIRGTPFVLNTGCSAPLGMESRLIKDSQITASSQWDGNHAAIQARLNFLKRGHKRGGWSSRWNNANQWIQVDLRSYTKLTSIATQGRNGHSQWVTKYKLQYSDDGVNFLYYKVPGQSSAKVKSCPMKSLDVTSR